MTEQPEVLRDERGRVLPGSKLNTAGSSIRAKQRAEAKQQIAAAAPEIIAKQIELAKAGDVQAAKLLLDKLIPNAKPTAELVGIPGVQNAQGLAAKAEAIIAAAVSGEIPTDTAQELIQSLAGLSKIKEIDELEQRIKNLEEGRVHDLI